MLDFLQTIARDPQFAQAAAAIFGAFAVLLGTLVSSFLSRDKFQRELLWEKRQEACNTIVSNLKSANAPASAIENGFLENAYGYWESDALNRTYEHYSRFLTAAHTAFESNYLLLPPQFRRRYERMVFDRSGWWEVGGPEGYLGPIKVNRVAADDLLGIALSELGIAPFGQSTWLKWRPALRAAPERASRMFRKVRRWVRRRKQR